MAKKVEITNKLLREAIADAEAVRQTAIENAKISLEETFTPQIKSMLSRRLRAEAEGMDDDEEDTDVEKVSTEKEAPSAPSAPTAPKTETAKELPFQDGEAEGSSEFPADSSVIGGSDNKEPSDDSFDSSAIGDGGESEHDSHTDWYDDWSESDFDLDEVIMELENDINKFEKEEPAEGEESEHGSEEMSDDEATDEAYPDEEPQAGTKKPEIPAMSSTIGKDEGAGMAADVQKFVADPATPKMEGGEEEMQGQPQDAMHADGEDEAELDLNAILQELEAEEEQRKQHQLATSHKVANLEKKLAEYRAAVDMLRENLKEVNLLNAKLLYTNRIFRKEGLNNEQKVMVVENFDRATTVREVKMVYTVLVETLSSAAKVVKSTKSTKKVVAEGLASKATPSTAPKTPAKDLITEDSVARRLQQLAGIIS